MSVIPQTLTAAPLSGSGVATSSVSYLASYVIYKSGTQFQATSPIGLADVPANADAGAVLQACMDNINSSTTPRGTIVFAPNTVFTWSSVPSIRRTFAAAGSDDNKWLKILGSGGTVIQLSASGPRFLDINRQANGDGFCGLEIGNLAIDGNNIGGSNHVIIGTYRAGSDASGQQINLRRWWLHDIDTYNVAVANDGSTTAHRLNVRLHDNAASAETWTDLTFTRIRMNGGNGGLYVTGSGTGCFIDRVTFEDCYHDRGLDYNISATPANNFFIGSGALVGVVRVKDCIGKRCTDSGIEIDNYYLAIHENCHFDDAPQAYYLQNFSAVSWVKAQRAVYTNCTAKMTNGYPHSAAPRWGSAQPNFAMGSIEMYDCSMHVGSAAEIGSFAWAGPFFGGTTAEVSNVLIDGFRLVLENVTWTGASSRTWRLIGFHAAVGKMNVTLRNIYIDINGTRTVNGGNTAVVWAIALDGAEIEFEIDGVDYSCAITNAANLSTRCITFGSNNSIATQVMRGVVRNGKVRTMGGGDAQPRFALVNEGNSATILATSASRVIFEDCDFANLTGSTGELFVGTNSKPFVTFDRIRWLTWPPAEITFTPGASTVSAQYLGGIEGLMTITGGTVTVIEVSADGSTFRQIGTVSGIAFYIDHGMHVRMTYSVTPTCKVVPRR